MYFSDEALTVAETDTIIANAIVEFGFTPERLAVGREMYNATYAAYIHRKDLYAAQLEATDLMKSRLKAFRSLFKSDRQIISGLLENTRSELERFALNTGMNPNRENLMDQATRFYTQVKNSESLLAKLQERFMIPAEMLDARLVEVQALVGIIKDQQVIKAEAQLATQRRLEAEAALDAWMGSFIVYGPPGLSGGQEAVGKARPESRPQSETGRGG